ncbi:MAG: cytochrome c oxidase subunit 3 [Cytophagaceae bacterium]|nr:cytochrome c oxidase subunit 3 [Cytophagaceae bacterium]
MPQSSVQKSATEPWLTRRREPFTYLLTLGMLGSALLFGVLLFAYLMRKGSTDWHDVVLPRIFWASTAIMIISSFSLHAANRALRHERFLHYRILLGITLLLGLCFVVMQVWGWKSMIDTGVKLNKDLAGAFIYLLSGVHLIHIAGGLVALLMLWAEALRRTSYVDTFVYVVNPPTRLKIRLITLYWHFVDALWLAVFLFLLYHHQK